MFVDDLLLYLFDGQPHILAAPMAMWLSSSRRFAAFVTTFRTKIRKKLRATPEPESVRDLRLELETAYLLLQERSLSLVYEPQSCGQSRCPDFAVSFTTSVNFMVEVTRLRNAQDTLQNQTQTPAQAPSAPNTAPRRQVDERLADVVCSKLGQLVPQRSNILVVGVEALQLNQDDLRVMMLRVQQRAEHNDIAFVQRHKFRDRSDFFQHYQRLSEIVVRGEHVQAAASAIVWVNPQAKHPLPSKVQTVVYRSHHV